MIDDSHTAQILDDIRKRRGYVLPSHQFLARNDPPFLQAYDQIFTLATDTHNGLAPQVKELLLLAIDLSLGISPEIAGKHAQRAVEYGATEQETVAVIELVTLSLAAKGLNAGVAALMSAEPSTS